MNFKEFINYNSICPICKNELTLFMQWVDTDWTKNEKLFIATQKKDLYHFTEFPLNTRQLNLYAQKTGENKELSFNVKDKSSVEFNCLSTKKLAQSYQSVYFFWLCNPGSINIKEGDYKIIFFDACYYRSTPYIKFVDVDKKTIVDYNSFQYVNRDENFIIQDRNSGNLKAYFLSLNYEYEKTLFWHYSATPEEEAQEDFTPLNPFEAEMPLLNKTPDVSSEGREKLLDRFNSWIIMS